MAVEESVVTAVDTAGRAVLFAGTIVCIALLGMFALGVTFLYGLPVAAALAVLLVLAMLVATVTERSPALPVALAVLGVPIGAAAVAVVALRLVAEPGLGVGASDAEVAVRLPAFLGLVAAAALLAGDWIALADDRTDTPEAREQAQRVLAVRGAPRPAPPAEE
jgi:RND superfamily putative drug exporter